MTSLDWFLTLFAGAVLLTGIYATILWMLLVDRRLDRDAKNRAGLDSVPETVSGHMTKKLHEWAEEADKEISDEAREQRRRWINQERPKGPPPDVRG